MKKIFVVLAALSVAGCNTLEVGKRANPPHLVLTSEMRPLQPRALAAHMIAISDQRCEDYLIGLNIQKNSWGSGISILGSFLSVLGGIVSDVKSANALSSLGGWGTDSADKVESLVFAEKNYNVIYQAVKSGRALDRSAFLSNMNQFDGLTSEEVHARILPYDLNCGINYGISELARAVQSEKQRTPTVQVTSVAPAAEVTVPAKEAPVVPPATTGKDS